jgi:hypothetical protein
MTITPLGFDWAGFCSPRDEARHIAGSRTVLRIHSKTGRPMSQLGQTRPVPVILPAACCPVCSESGRIAARQRNDVMGHEETSQPNHIDRPDYVGDVILGSQQKCLRGPLNPLRRSGGVWFHRKESLARCQRYRERGFGPATSRVSADSRAAAATRLGW